MEEIALELLATKIICLSSRTIHRYEIPISQVTMDIFPFIYIILFPLCPTVNGLHYE
jgi:hypothetical protein